MTSWSTGRASGGSARGVMVFTLLAALLVAAVPVALLAAVVLMVLGHLVVGLAVFGGSVLAAGLAITLAGMSGLRHLRQVLSGLGLGSVPSDGRYADLPEPLDSSYADAVRLDRGDYTEIR
jgi:hypothetical protein